MKMMEYAENFNCAPLLLEELAEAALRVEDNPAFVADAKAFLDSKAAFEAALAEHDIEMG